MHWTVETDPSAYAERVLPWLAREPAVRSVPATIARGAAEGLYDAWLAWLDDGGEVAGAAVRTPPRNIVLTDLPAGAAAGLAAVVGPGLPGTAGPAAEAEAFTVAYADRHGARAQRDLRSRLFRLTRLAAPPRPAGGPRRAGEDDVELLAAWWGEFTREVGLPDPTDPRPQIRRVVAGGRMLLWEVDGTSVAMVGHGEPVAGVPRIAPVYTPPRHRRRGYATAATAASCQELLAAGAVAVVLFADRANPTSTGIYERIGFRPVAEWDDWRLEY